MIRKANLKDLDEIELICENAKKIMQKRNINQWNKNYPLKKDFKNDILNENAYVIVNNNDILFYFALLEGEDDNYKKINGKWLNDDFYVTLHRTMSSFKQKKAGVKYFEIIFEFLKKKGFKNLRIDTHKDNKNMINLIENTGFLYCGIVQMKDKTFRNAYQKLL